MSNDSTAPKTILIVDDTELNIDMLLLILKEYDLIPVISGEDALAAVRKESVDLILLDIMMPGMDGFTVCRKLKAERETRDIPVIFLTARTDEDSIEEAYEIGGADYVTKPFRPRELMARVRIQLELRETIEDLRASLANAKTLSGLLPICSVCKKIRDDKGYWKRLESYIETHSDASFSHGMCHDCSETLYGKEEWYDSIRKKRNKQE